jgi:3-deoxy-D-manno-octulosonic acid kinase
LNARNILLDAESQVFLIDFDRARFRPGERVNGEGNLNRLKRSLAKLWPANEKSAQQLAWTELKAGYDE